MKIYTRTGDAGTTSLVGGTRVSKASPRLEAYGTADELNSHLGLLLAWLPAADVTTRATLNAVQKALFCLGSELATEPDSKYKPVPVEAEQVAALEAEIDRMEEQLPKHNKFILPAGTQAACQAHVARTVARRLERRMVEMADAGMPVSPVALKLVNRLSDYLFVLSRLLNVQSGAGEEYWN